MTDDEYIVYRDGRFADAVKFYDDRAKSNKTWYNRCSIFVLMASVLLAPILIANPLGFGKDIAIFLSPMIAIFSGISMHYRFHENWLNYRATWDALQHEIHFREARLLDYRDSGDRNATFVSRVEALISSEGAQWLECQARKERVDIGSKGIKSV